MTGKGLGLCIGCLVVGAVGGALMYKHREKVKPTAAAVLAKSIRLKEKAVDYAARVKEHAEDVVAEAKHINEKPVKAKS